MSDDFPTPVSEDYFRPMAAFVDGPVAGHTVQMGVPLKMIMVPTPDGKGIVVYDYLYTDEDGIRLYGLDRVTDPEGTPLDGPQEEV